MKRREFVAASAVMGAGTLPRLNKISKGPGLAEEHELYELRKYELAFGGNRNQLISYLRDVLFPALTSGGVRHTLLLKEQGDAEPAQIWALIAYPDFGTYQQCLQIPMTTAFIEASGAYTDTGKTYNRYTSMLLSAFDGMSSMTIPSEGKELFELRIYEGMNEDAVRRKVMMFNNEEIALFKKVGLDAVFFGNMVIGPYMPCLVYMLSFPSMEARKNAWGKFVAHPDWLRMKDLPIYANTLSNIRKIFLEKV